MKKDNLKRIIKQFETLIEELKSEVYSDKDSYVHPWDEHMKNTPRMINTEDDDGYADQLARSTYKKLSKLKEQSISTFLVILPIALEQYKKQIKSKEFVNDYFTATS